MKHSVRARGTLTTGTAGVGFVAVAPASMTVGGMTGAPTDVRYPVAFTTSAYAGTTIAPAAVGVSATSSNTPYAQTLGQTALQVRIVACGLRIKNTTALLSRGGAGYGGEALTHRDLDGISVTSFNLMDTTEYVRTTADEWQSVVFHPDDAADLEFKPVSEFGTNGIPVLDGLPAYILAFLLVAPTGAAQTYEFETYCVFEAIGTAVHGLTPSLSDPIGLAYVRNATSATDSRKPRSGERAAYVNNIAYGLGVAAGAVQTLMEGYNTRRGRPMAAPNLPQIEYY